VSERMFESDLAILRAVFGFTFLETPSIQLINGSGPGWPPLCGCGHQGILL